MVDILGVILKYENKIVDNKFRGKMVNIILTLHVMTNFC